MPTELWDHSEPCIHVNATAVELAAARAISHPNDVPVWKCHVTGCPGGREVIINYEAATLRAAMWWVKTGASQLPVGAASDIVNAALEIGETDAD